MPGHPHTNRDKFFVKGDLNMSWFKRIAFFMMINLLVILTVTFVMNLFNVAPYIQQYGLDYQSLAIFCGIWGMVGSFISLGMSRMMAKWMMGVQIIDDNTRDSSLQELRQTVHQLARAAGLGTMPEVGIYNSPEINAFATGPTKNRSLVAVSAGLLHHMNRDEVEGVLGHEVSHIANGDMVTMTLIQGVVNAFVMFLARVIAFGVDAAMRRNDDDRGGIGSSFLMYWVVIPALEGLLMFLAYPVVALFSRWREYRADAGSARIAGRDKMIRALHALQRTVEAAEDPNQSQPAFQSLKISTKGSWLKFWSTHPPLEARIAALESFSK